MKDLEQIKTKALGFPERAKKLIVHNETTLLAANEFVQDVKELIKAVSDSYDPIISHAKSEKKKYIEPLRESERTVKTYIASYFEKQEELRRIAEEEARKKEELRQKKEQEVVDEAKELEREGKYEEAEDKIEEVPLPPKPAEHVMPEAVGLSFKKILDTERINSLVNSSHGKIKIPGITIYAVHTYKWQVVDRSLIPKGYYKTSVASRKEKVETEVVIQGKPEDD